jgi:hypothetical protein
LVWSALTQRRLSAVLAGRPRALRGKKKSGQKKRNDSARNAGSIPAGTKPLLSLAAILPQTV